MVRTVDERAASARARQVAGSGVGLRLMGGRLGESDSSAEALWSASGRRATHASPLRTPTAAYSWACCVHSVE